MTDQDYEIARLMAENARMKTQLKYLLNACENYEKSAKKDALFFYVQTAVIVLLLIILNISDK